ncbi:hypothetical protein ACX93W_09185 [Paenibacillus sp. CAU 1782]
MKILSTMGILLLTLSIIFGEWRGSRVKKVRAITTGITLATAVLALLLLFQPSLPGPSQVVKLLFGKLDKMMQ